MKYIDWLQTCIENEKVYYYNKGLYKVPARSTSIVYEPTYNTQAMETNDSVVKLSKVFADRKECVKEYVNYLQTKYLGGDVENNN